MCKRWVRSLRARTPGKCLPRPLNHQHVRKCCNFSFVSYSIDLFGAKSESESLLSSIVKVTGLIVSESDLLRKICWIDSQQFSELKDLCQRSRPEKENPSSHNRGKKTEESPFAAKEWESKQVTQRNRMQIHSEAQNPKS